MENLVRTTTSEVIRQAKYVKINQERIDELAKQWAKEDLLVPEWSQDMHLKTKNSERMLDYLILLDSANFCFWSKKERWQIDYEGKKYNGYFAWAKTLALFFEKNPEKANLEYFSRISLKEFKEDVLQGGKNLLFFKKRCRILNRVSSAILKKYGSSVEFIESASRDASILAKKIYRDLPFFGDVSLYNQKRVYFLKRAQILISEIWGAFDGKGLGEFSNMDYLTCFPDYKIPQILNYFGIIEYSSILDDKIKNRKLIPHNSKAEIEIRSATVQAVEYLKEALKKESKDLKSFELDWILWNKAQQEQIEKPYHLTATIYY